MADAVRAEALTKRFGDFEAVADVTFRIAPGEVFGFLGPNGAGKTTTIKMLTGLLTPTAGQGEVSGHDIVAERDGLRSGIGYMSQLFSLYPDLTVDENIQLFAGLYGLTGSRLRDRRAWVIDMAGLEGRADHLTGSLPLGWKQRLALGCAVIHEPPVLFLDEPTSGVDPMARRRFWNLIDDLAGRDTAVLVSTHYMEEAENCHRIALMNRGRVIATDTPRALRARMHEPIIELVTDHAAETVGALAGHPLVVEASLYGRAVRVVVRDHDEATRALPALLAERGITCRSSADVVPTLEDVFVAEVRKSGGALAS